MAVGLIGRKCGMTRIFIETNNPVIFANEGDSLPVTVIEVTPNRVVQIKTDAADGYTALQVTAGEKKRSRLSKALSGHYVKANVIPGRNLWEFRIHKEEEADFSLMKSLQPGSELGVEHFSVGQLVDVTSFCSKGKGFAGTMKRHGFAGGDATHGNSLSHRAPGSIGQRQSPGKVFKGKKMSGHMGAVRRTLPMQCVVRIDKERNLIFIRGGVPGAISGDVMILPAKKAPLSKEKK